MKNYKYFGMSLVSAYTGDLVLLTSTDSQVLGWASAEVQKLCPSSQVREDVFPSGEVYNVSIEKLGVKCGAVYWWIVKQLCLQGWEPFAVHYGDNGCTHDFRFEVTDNG